MPEPLQVRVKTVPETTVAYIAMRGPFSQVPEGLRKLYAWVTFKGYTPTAPPTGVYPADPESVPPDQLEWELRAFIGADAISAEANAEGLGVKVLPPTLMASAMHKGPYHKAERVWKALAEWIPANGYEIAGPGEELYFSGPDTPPDDTLTEVRFPVTKR